MPILTPEEEQKQKEDAFYSDPANKTASGTVDPRKAPAPAPDNGSSGSTFIDIANATTQGGGLFSGMDPTRVRKADGAGVANAEGAVGRVGAYAGELGDVGRAINPKQFDVTAPTVAPTALAQTPGALTTGTVRGTTQVVQAGQAQATQFSPAQIAELERMTAAGISREDAEFRLKQQGLASALEAQANGTAPSLAQAQLQRANEDAIKAQAAIAASSRGGNPVLAQRQAAQNVATIQQQNAGKSAELAIQEQATARQQLGQVLDSARGQDINVNAQQATLSQDAAKTNKVADDAKAVAQAQLVQDAAKTNSMTAADISKFNADLSAKVAMFNSDTDFKAAMSDAERALDAAKTTYLSSVDVSKFNAQAANEMERFKADSLLRTRVANQAAQLQATGMTIDAIAKQLGIELDSAKAVLASNDANFAVEQNRLMAAQQAKSKAIGGITSAVGSVIGAMSDSRSKTDIKSLDGDEKKEQSFAETLQKMSADSPEQEKEVEDVGGGIASLGKSVAGGMSSNEGSMFSDKRTKKDVKPAHSIDDFLSKLDGFSYHYKDPSLPGAAEGKRFGIMAQDLEKSEVGRSIVREDPESGYKKIDTEQAIGVILASLASLDKKLAKR